jgi:hypothetical protein
MAEQHKPKVADTAAPASRHARAGFVDLLAFLGVLAFSGGLALLVERTGQLSARLAFAGAAALVAGCTVGPVRRGTSAGPYRCGESIPAAPWWHRRDERVRVVAVEVSSTTLRAPRGFILPRFPGAPGPARRGRRRGHARRVRRGRAARRATPRAPRRGIPARRAARPARGLRRPVPAPFTEQDEILVSVWVWITDATDS